MSSFYDYRTLHPAVTAGIEYQDDREGSVDDKPCGCHQRGEQPWKWWLCSYHEGMQDGVEAVLPPVGTSAHSELVDRLYERTETLWETDGFGPDDMISALVSALAQDTGEKP